MLQSLRVYFLGRLLREKLLLMLFIVLGMLWWLSSFGTRAGRLTREVRSTTFALKDQQKWLNNRVAVETSVKKAASLLDASKTLDAVRLATEVSNLASAAGYRNNVSADPVVTTATSLGSVHTLNYLVRNVVVRNREEWLALEKFYVALRDRVPYISIDKFTLAVNPSNRTQHNLTLTISSIEIAR